MKRLLTNLKPHLQGKYVPNDLLQITINVYRSNSVIIKLNYNRTDCQSINDRAQGALCHQHYITYT